MFQTFIINNGKPSFYVNELMKSWPVQGAQNQYRFYA